MKLKKYFWIIILAAGILTLISLITPALYIRIHLFSDPGTQEFWMWGLYTNRVPGVILDTGFILTDGPFEYGVPIFLSGIIPVILILISSVMLIIIANGIRKDENMIISAGNKLIGWGTTLCLGSMVYLIVISFTLGIFVEHLFTGGFWYSSPNMWDLTNLGFAVIGPFIGAALALLSGILSKTIKRREKS